MVYKGHTGSQNDTLENASKQEWFVTRCASGNSGGTVAASEKQTNHRVNPLRV